MKRAVRLALRALALACLALIPLGVLRRSPLAPPRYVLVLDDSPSVQRRFPGLAERVLGLWKTFEGGGHAVVRAGSRPLPEGVTEEHPRATDLPAALRAAAELGPPGVETRLLLVTDGLWREDRLTETLALLRERRVRVSAVSPPQGRTQAGALELVLPARVRLQEPFAVRVRVAASRPGPLRVRLRRDGEAVAEATVIVDAAGRGEVDVPQELGRTGRVRYAAEVAEYAAAPAVGEVTVAQSPRVRWISGDPGAAVNAITPLREAGIPVQAVHPAELLFARNEFARDEVIVLDDVPVAALGEDLVDALRGAVSSAGAGLLVVGGRKGLGSGGYAGTVLEAMLPARTGYDAPPPPEEVSLVLALDTSLSMFFRGRGEPYFAGSAPSKMDVALESVRQVVRIVRPGDRLGVLGNSDDVFWIARLGPVVDREALVADLDRVRPVGAGIFFYSVLHEARAALREVPEGARHVLVLCDANDIDQYEITGQGHAFDLVRDMAREGMTVSVIAFGSPVDKDVPFLRTVALLGRGDFYLVPRLVALPRYFVAEYRRLTSARHVLEEEMTAVPGPEGSFAAGQLPGLSGIALVTPREGSRTVLQTSLGPPLLVAGEFGRGRTAVFAGDSGSRWTSRWEGSAAARRLWLQMLFDVAPRAERELAFDSALEADTGEDRLRFRYAGKEAAPPPWDTLWALPAPGDPGAPLALDRVGLRSYRGREPLGSAGYRRVTIAEDEAGERPLLVTGYPVPPAEEDLPLPPRWGAVRRLVEGTGGAWVGEPGDIRGAPALADRLPAPPAVLIAAAAVLLLLAEVLVRTLWEE